MPVTSSELRVSVSPLDQSISLPEVISAMTFALDLTEGALPGHGLRCCLLGMRLADALPMTGQERASLYYALQLKDVGCSSNSSRVTQIMGGDDREIKASTKLENWRKSSMSTRGLKAFWKNTLPEASLALRAGRFLKVARDAAANRKQLIEMRCERGADILSQLEMSEATTSAVRALDEHWDGGGYPHGCKGADIPLGARICSITQHLDIFGAAYGPEIAVQTLRERSGVWFDPNLVELTEQLTLDGGFWDGFDAGMDELRAHVVGCHPGDFYELPADRIDRICEAFAAVVDAKSPFTFRHSLRVAQAALAIATQMGLQPECVRMLYRAGLLHDIGKLGLPNSILEKAGELDMAEWVRVLGHPGLSRSILERVAAFSELAVIAGEHHERLDGTGYPLGLTAEHLSLASRILSFADVFVAMTEDRPYAGGMDVADAIDSLAMHVPHKLDAECFEALKGAIRTGLWQPLV